MSGAVDPFDELAREIADQLLGPVGTRLVRQIVTEIHASHVRPLRAAMEIARQEIERGEINHAYHTLGAALGHPAEAIAAWNRRAPREG